MQPLDSLNIAGLIGVALFIAGFINLFWRTESKGKYQHHVLTSVVFWVSGFTLYAQGWRMDPILQFGQVLIAINIFLIVYENIQLRNRLFKLKKSLANNTSIAQRFKRNIGKNMKEDLELMEDKEVYEIVKLQLLGISNGDIKPESGEVEYLKDILNILQVNQ